MKYIFIFNSLYWTCLQIVTIIMHPTNYILFAEIQTLNDVQNVNVSKYNFCIIVNRLVETLCVVAFPNSIKDCM
jgi:hypothetical protein